MTRDEVAELVREALRTLGHDLRERPADDAPWPQPKDKLTVLYLVGGTTEAALNIGYELLEAQTFGEVVDAIAQLFAEPVAPAPTDADEAEAADEAERPVRGA